MRRLATVINFALNTAKVIIFVLGTISAALLAVVGLLVLLGAISAGGTIQYSFDRGLEYDRQFREAATEIEAFEQSHGRRPTEDELESILRPRDNYTMLASAGFDQCWGDPSAYASLRKPDYVLANWRSDWWECYAPTRGLSTLDLDWRHHRFYFLMLQLVVALVGVAFLLAAYWLWRLCEHKPAPPGEA